MSPSKEQNFICTLMTWPWWPMWPGWMLCNDPSCGWQPEPKKRKKKLLWKVTWAQYRKGLVAAQWEQQRQSCDCYTSPWAAQPPGMAGGAGPLLQIKLHLQDGTAAPRLTPPETLLARFTADLLNLLQLSTFKNGKSASPTKQSQTVLLLSPQRWQTWDGPIELDPWWSKLIIMVWPNILCFHNLDEIRNSLLHDCFIQCTLYSAAIDGTKTNTCASL